MSRPLEGSRPEGTTVTSGTVSAAAALGAGDITINTVAMPAVASGVTAAGQTQAVVDAINSMFTQTGVRAERVTSTTFKLHASVNIVIAALGGTATTANTGLTAGTTTGASTVLATRVAFGSGVANDDSAIIVKGGREYTVKHAKAMGFMDVAAGIDIANQDSATATRTDA